MVRKTSHQLLGIIRAVIAHNNHLPVFVSGVNDTANGVIEVVARIISRRNNADERLVLCIHRVVQNTGHVLMIRDVSSLANHGAKEYFPVSTENQLPD